MERFDGGEAGDGVFDHDVGDGVVLAEGAGPEACFEEFVDFGAGIGGVWGCGGWLWEWAVWGWGSVEEGGRIGGVEGDGVYDEVFEDIEGVVDGHEAVGKEK